MARATPAARPAQWSMRVCVSVAPAARSAQWSVKVCVSAAPAARPAQWSVKGPEGGPTRSPICVVPAGATPRRLRAVIHEQH